MKEARGHYTPFWRTLWIVLVYLLAAGAWITWSDNLAERWFTDPHTLSRVQTWKGALFVAVTAGFLFAALYRQLRRDRLVEGVLKERERQLATLMDNLPGMAYRCLNDRHWTMKFVSSGCYELTGYRPDELQDNQLLSYASLIDPEDNALIQSTIAESIVQQQAFSLEYRLTRKDGRQIWVWERGRAVEDGSETILEGIVLDNSEHKRLEQELAEQAIRDPLTGLINRRELSRLLNEEIRRAERYGRHLAVAWIDLDHFKRVNDHHGHAAGDTVLQWLSQLLTDSIRSVDVIGRVGGEEFVALFPEMDLEEAMEAAERLRKLVSHQGVTLADGLEVRLTISLGVALYPDHGGTAEELCIAADRAMYRAKESGRNRVVLAGPESSAAPAGMREV